MFLNLALSFYLRRTFFPIFSLGSPLLVAAPPSSSLRLPPDLPTTRPPSPAPPCVGCPSASHLRPVLALPPSSRPSAPPSAASLKGKSKKQKSSKTSSFFSSSRNTLRLLRQRFMSRSRDHTEAGCSNPLANTPSADLDASLFLTTMSRTPLHSGANTAGSHTVVSESHLQSSDSKCEQEQNAVAEREEGEVLDPLLRDQYVYLNPNDKIYSRDGFYKTEGISGGGPSCAKEVELRKMKKFQRLKASIWKKVEELSILCDIPVCLILVSPDGKKETWSENTNDVKALVDVPAKREGESEHRKLMKRRQDDPVTATSGAAKSKRQKTTRSEGNLEISQVHESVNTRNEGSLDVSQLNNGRMKKTI